MSTSQLEKDNIEDVEEEYEDSLPTVYGVSSYGADYTVEVIVSRMAKGIIVKPKFQRHYVWTRVQASRFIETLLLGLPSPGIFLAGNPGNDAEYWIVDGQQRLQTLRYFLEGKFNGRKFSLIGVDSRWHRRDFSSLEPQDQERLNNSIIHSTIIKQDFPEKNISGIYHIFERINSGGIRLMPQEIRACFANYNDLLQLAIKANDNASWRAICGKKHHPRMKDQELIIRFWAGCMSWQDYKKPMKLHLNNFCDTHARLDDAKKAEMLQDFAETIHLANELFGKSAFSISENKSSLNASLFDAIMVGLWHLQKSNGRSIRRPEEIKGRYQELLANGDFIHWCERTPSDAKHYKARIEKAISAFA